MDTWADCCRCCLSPDCEVSILDSEQNIAQFLEITTIQVEEGDCLPNKLCTSCYDTMNSAYQFRQKCIEMDSELRTQLANIFDSQNVENAIKVHEITGDDIANDPMKQLQSIIKQEPTDSDDDCYYVLVIDDQKDKDDKKTNQLPKVDKKAYTEEKSIVKFEKFDNVKVETADPGDYEMDSFDESQDSHDNQFEVSYDSFLMSDKVPANVPATILENEEISHENYDIEHDMDIDETQDSTSQDQNYAELIDEEGNQIQTITAEQLKNLSGSKNLIKLLSAANSDGTILLESNDAIQYLTDGEIMTNADDDGEETQEVILCEGDDSSQFQILKYDGSELVIEYGDDSQIATVIQQEDGTFLCDCGDQFDDLVEYEKHQYKHNPAGEHLCNMCGKGFESADILTGHMLLHNFSGPMITCPFCEQSIKRNSLTQHIKYSHNNIKPRCDVCFKTFANPNNLKRHAVIHTGFREFECDICQKRFHQKITMQTHKLTHMNPYSCNQCDQTFENKDTLAAHKESEECSKSKVIKVKEELLKTVKKEVTTNLGKLLGYACSLCTKMFSVESALEQHIESTHIIDPADLICLECGKVLACKKDMETHMQTHKSLKVKNIKRFECSICNKSCTSQAMLLMHERVHTNERPFPCQLCSLRFKTKTHLRTHQLTHTREKKYGCSVCMKFFALKGNLVVHSRTHTGERPYVCSICKEAFIDSKYLKKHKLKKHAIDNVPWNQY